MTERDRERERENETNRDRERVMRPPGEQEDRNSFSHTVWLRWRSDTSGDLQMSRGLGCTVGRAETLPLLSFIFRLLPSLCHTYWRANTTTPAPLPSQVHTWIKNAMHRHCTIQQMESGVKTVRVSNDKQLHRWERESTLETFAIYKHTHHNHSHRTHRITGKYVLGIHRI